MKWDVIEVSASVGVLERLAEEFVSLGAINNAIQFEVERSNGARDLIYFCQRLCAKSGTVATVTIYPEGVPIPSHTLQLDGEFFIEQRTDLIENPVSPFVAALERHYQSLAPTGVMGGRMDNVMSFERGARYVH